MSDSPPIRVILADDHAVVRKGIREFLEADGAITVVAEAGNGPEALALIRTHRPAVAVLDIQMPGQSGIEVARAVRTERLPVGLLILTAYEDEPYIRAVLQAGANGYVLKTAEAHEIVQAVIAVSERQSALDPTLVYKLLVKLAPAESPPEPLTDRELEVFEITPNSFTNEDSDFR